MKDPYLRCDTCHQRVTAEMDDKNHCELIDAIERSRSEMREQIAALTAERDRLALQIAGCLTVAEGHTKEHAIRGEYGWSLAYEKTLQLSKKLAASEAANAQMREALKLIENYNLCDKCGTVPIEDCPKCNETATFRTAHIALKLPNGQPLLDKLARYRAALGNLALEAKGFLSQASALDHGHTNMNVLAMRISEALAETEKPDGEE